MSGQRLKKRLDAAERRAALVEREVITEEEAGLLSVAHDHFSDGRIENQVGSIAIPVGLAEHFVINGRAIEGVPMATEETSVIAAASKAAKLAARCGGFTVAAPFHATVRGHVLYSFPDQEAERAARLEINDRLVDFAARLREDGPLARHGGGTLTLACERHQSSETAFLVINIGINPAEAMGANVVTRVGIRLAEMVKRACRIDATGMICTNHESGWEVEAMASWPYASIGAERMQGMLDWHEFAEVEMDRAVTHNKGIMNGVTAVALATGQDTRAIEACVHASAIISGQYLPLTSYWLDTDTKTLNGSLQITLPVATKGGMTHHPQAVVYRQIMGATTARELASIMVAVGLAQNFGALYCLAGEGIPAAHATLAKAR